MKLTYDESKKIFLFECGYPDREIPKEAGFFWDKGIWKTKDPHVAIRVSRFANQELKNKFKQFRRYLDKKIAESSKVSSDFQVPSPSNLNFFPFQKAGIEYIWENRDVLVADPTGSGKTPTSIGVINKMEDFKHILIICPNSLKLNWKREIKRWMTHENKSIVVCNTKNFRVADIMIINFEAFASSTNKKSHKYKKPKSGKYNATELILNQLKKIDIDALIIDESHRIKNYSANTTRNIFKIRKNCKRKILLSATPVLNKPIDLWTSIKFLGMEKKFGGTKKNFGNRYCDPKFTPWGITYDGATNLQELQTKLRKEFMLRRKKEHILTELPPKIRQYVPIDIDDEYMDLIKEFDVDQSLITLTEKNEDSAISKSVFAGIKPADLESIAQIRKIAGEAKIPAVCEYVENILQSEEKVVIFGHHTHVLEAYARKLKKYGAVLLTGKVDQDQRQKNVDAFQNDKNCRVIICNFKVGGVGLTLTASNNVVFAEFDFVPAMMTQSEDRCHRIGTKYLVVCHYMVAENTLDAYIADILISKQEVIDKTVEHEYIL